MTNPTRRTFQKATLGAAASAVTALSQSRVAGANERIRVGAIGTGKVIFFTGVRYERIVTADVGVSAKVALSRKPANQRRGRPVGVLA